MPVRVAPVIAVLAVTAIAAATGGGAAASGKARQCGLVRSGSEQFQVVETRGSVPCRTVRRVAATFLSSHRSLKSWHCFDNNASGGQPFAASCARGTSAVVRIYAPT